MTVKGKSLVHCVIESRTNIRPKHGHVMLNDSKELSRTDETCQVLNWTGHVIRRGLVQEWVRLT